MNYDRLKNIHQKHSKYILPIKPGMFLEIHENVGEGDTKRIWKFKGLVIKVKKPNHSDGTFTIRGEVARMTIEKIYPLSFPNFEKVILLDDYKIRRSKLYYIRDKVGKDARFKSLISAENRGMDLLEGLELVEKDKEEINIETNDTQVVVQETIETEKEVVEESAEKIVEENVENKETADVESEKSGEEEKKE
ncbi:MAG: 50S ribosomal protein L19 [Candidatus Absconditabacterales bacterium]|nr:50S ribosomal protein L19 [Candidatus Absconditabacterales bacterium]